MAVLLYHSTCRRGKRRKVITGIIHPHCVTMANTLLDNGRGLVGLPVPVSHVLAYLYHLLHQAKNDGVTSD
jgi:hypothetical protein